MFDKYSFKEPENTNQLTKQMTKTPWKPIQISIQIRKKKSSKHHQKNFKNRQKSPPERHLAPARAPGGAKWLKKRSVPEFWRFPGTHLGTPKSSKSQKNEVRKSIKNQNDLKEPPRADLKGFGVPRDLKKHQKMTPK